MFEKAKLNEAKYFYSQMLLNNDDREKFSYNLSAFLSSARSVLQYALEEAKGKNGGQAWYEKQISSSSILSFFKDKRDINIHAKPIHPTMHVNISITEQFKLIDSAIVIVKDANGKVISQSSTTPNNNANLEPSQKDESTTIRWFFSDWQGTEDVIILCQKYIDLLVIFINDGKSKGFITG